MRIIDAAIIDDSSSSPDERLLHYLLLIIDLDERSPVAAVNSGSEN
jgi:hypothetical protein